MPTPPRHSARSGKRPSYDVPADCPSLHGVFPLLTKATGVASQRNASINDCLYLALAEVHDCQFVTADRKILNAFPNESRIIDLSTI